jgi:cytochrome c oxidase cbb3-type subunit III
MIRLQCLLLATSMFAALLSGCGNPPGYPKPEAEVLRPEDQLSFTVLYKQNCSACHGEGGQNGASIDLANPVYQALVDDQSLKKWISGGMPGTQMPAWAISQGGPLTDRQIDVLVRGMRGSWSRQNPLGGEIAPAYLQVEKGNALQGQHDYNTYCASCHQRSAQQVSSPDYLALVSDQALRTIIVAGRPDIGHPDWRQDKAGAPLSSQNVTDIVTYLATLRSPTPGQPYPKHP